jgi:hypothetical protein
MKMNTEWIRKRILSIVFLSVILFFSSIPWGQTSGDLDRQFRLENVGVLKAVDNVDGFFSEYVSNAFERYISNSGRLVWVDLRTTESAFKRTKLPYEKAVYDSEILKQLALSTHSDHLVRTLIQKVGNKRVLWHTAFWILPHLQVHNQENKQCRSTVKEYTESE